MKIAVTGASGFIGSNLCNFLAVRQHHVIALVRSIHKGTVLQSMGLQTKICDITDRAALNIAFEDVDVVMHLAALFNNMELSWDDFHRTNVLGLTNVLEAARQGGVRRVIHCSTVGVATGVGRLPYSEEIPYSPLSNDKYETTKCEAETVALDFYRKYGFPIVVIRPAQVYGPGDRAKAKFYRLVKKRIIINPGNTLRHPIFIDDLCRAFELAATSDQAVGEVFIIAQAEPILLKDFIKIVAQELGVGPPIIKLPAAPITWLCMATETVSKLLRVKVPLFRRSMEFFTKSLHFDVSKASNQLGFQSQIDVLTGVTKTAAWYKENDLL